MWWLEVGSDPSSSSELVCNLEQGTLFLSLSSQIGVIIESTPRALVSN